MLMGYRLISVLPGVVTLKVGGAALAATSGKQLVVVDVMVIE
jgi:hypothetical protein